MAKVCDLHKKEQHKKHLHQLHKKLHKHEEGFHKHEDELDNCPYCNEDDRTDDCAYCQDLDAQENADGTAGLDDCQQCKEYDAANQNTGGIDDCPYCQTENIEEGQAHPDQFSDINHSCNCPNCPKNDQTGLAVEDMGAERPEDCAECQKMYGDAVENEDGQTGQEDPNLQGHETAEEVLDLLDQEPGQGAQTPEAAAKKIDNTEMPQGDQMKDGTSVKEDFGPAQQQEVSDSEKEFGEDGHDCNCPDCPGSQDSVPVDGEFPQEDAGQEEPDMADVMQGGLQDHEDDQKKQQVLDMVVQTLAGFKANKAALEESKEQNQGLYNSCIQMLKSMIELCKLLGLEPQMPSESAAPVASDDQAIQQEAKADPSQKAPKSSPPQSKPSPKENPAAKKAVG